MVSKMPTGTEFMKFRPLLGSVALELCVLSS